jgi:SPP1 gp7 family putative phage head morphogenesis protein
MPDINDVVNREFMKHAHFLLRAENGISKKAAKPLSDAVDSLSEMLQKDGLSLYRQKKLGDLRRQLTSAMDFANSDSQQELAGQLADMARREARMVDGTYRSMGLGSVLGDFHMPDVNNVNRLVNTPLGGIHWQQRMRQTYGDAVDVMQSSLATSMALGEGSKKAARRLRKVTSGIPRHRLEMIARTETARVVNESRREYYNQHQDLFKLLQVNESLDGRTCLVCANLDGKTYTFQDTPPVHPIHPRCRGTLVGLTHSEQDLIDLGIDTDDIPKRTRASMTGRVPRQQHYPSWFAQQSDKFKMSVLGKKRFKWYKQGKLPLNQMVQDGRILSLDQLSTIVDMSQTATAAQWDVLDVVKLPALRKPPPFGPIPPMAPPAPPPPTTPTQRPTPPPPQPAPVPAPQPAPPPPPPPAPVVQERVWIDELADLEELPTAIRGAVQARNCTPIS